MTEKEANGNNEEQPGSSIEHVISTDAPIDPQIQGNVGHAVVSNSPATAKEGPMISKNFTPISR